MAMTINIHDVASIELANTFRQNSNQRKVRITDTKGNEFELVVFGETDALDFLPRSEDFRSVVRSRLNHEDAAVAS